jgi:hypothetical protein
MKAVSSSFMTALVLIALFLGNCLTCPQLIAAAAHHPAHSCCHHPQPVQAGCQSQALQHFVKGESTSVRLLPETAAQGILAEAAVEASPISGLAPFTTGNVSPPDPPDPLSLNSAFRI